MHTAVILKELAGHLNHELFIYPWEMFEQRIQEEMIRSDRTGSYFAYVELHFENMEKHKYHFVEQNHFWGRIFEHLTRFFRGSDIMGYIEDSAGLGVVLLDVKKAGAELGGNRILESLKEVGWVAEELELQDFLKITMYPDALSSLVKDNNENLGD
ncbi:MAG: hypothetical protein GX801_00210 [Fibrobacter sp.]|nr:hypothetical protein [Fibrobacter sp.]